jgi:hypothetical protein
VRPVGASLAANRIMMQCFSGCFAPDAAASNGFQHQRLKDHHLKQSSSATGAWPLSLEPEVHVLLQPPSTSPFATTGTATASQHTLSSGFEPTYNSSSSKRAAAVPSSSSRSGPISREQLRHEYLLQHGSNIMAASTLQQDLRYFVVPGGLRAFAAPHGRAYSHCRLAVGTLTARNSPAQLHFQLRQCRDHQPRRFAVHPRTPGAQGCWHHVQRSCKRCSQPQNVQANHSSRTAP